MESVSARDEVIDLSRVNSLRCASRLAAPDEEKTHAHETGRQAPIRSERRVAPTAEAAHGCPALWARVCEGPGTAPGRPPHTHAGNPLTGALAWPAKPQRETAPRGGRCHGWRRGPESNRPTRICNPVHNRFATAPWEPHSDKEKGSLGFPCRTWSGRRVSNSRPQPWQGCALPTELLPHRFDRVLAANRSWNYRPKRGRPANRPRLVA
jgi:hypothetical protein